MSQAEMNDGVVYTASMDALLSPNKDEAVVFVMQKVIDEYKRGLTTKEEFLRAMAKLSAPKIEGKGVLVTCTVIIPDKTVDEVRVAVSEIDTQQAGPENAIRPDHVVPYDVLTDVVLGNIIGVVISEGIYALD